MIEKVIPSQDAVDRLDWRIQINVAFHRTLNRHVFIHQCEGRIAFYREAIASSTMPGPQHPRRSLAAVWTNRERASRIFAPQQQVFEITTALPGDALDRIERFREGGQLFARFEGKLFWLETTTQQGRAEEWLEDLVGVLSNNGRVLSWDICSAPFELTRDLWNQEILKKLRPPGRYILEVVVPQGAAHEELAKRALGKLEEARQAFDEGRYAEVARTSYIALEELRKLGEQVERRYGKHGSKQIAEQIKALTALCNPDRHGSQPAHDGLSFDRTLAQHVLAMATSIAAVVLV